jgi:hypothetical protein
MKTSSSTGYVTFPGFIDFGMNKYQPYEGSGNITAPDGYSVMISFPMFNMFGTVEVTAYQDDPGVANNDNATRRLQILSSWSDTRFKPVPARVYFNVRVISVRIYPDDSWDRSEEMGSFMMLYSFHKPSNTPQVVAKGVFNCSVNFYGHFKHHLHCNLQRECIHGEDETGWCNILFDK